LYDENLTVQVASFRATTLSLIGNEMVSNMFVLIIFDFWSQRKDTNNVTKTSIIRTIAYMSIKCNRPSNKG